MQPSKISNKDAGDVDIFCCIEQPSYRFIAPKMYEMVQQAPNVKATPTGYCIFEGSRFTTFMEGTLQDILP